MTFFRSILIAPVAVATLVASAAHAAQVDIAENGGFETGDFTMWDVFESAPGQTSIVSPGSVGTFAACIDNQQGTSGSVIKNSNIGVGVVMPSAMATITFDARGAGALGGVSFAEFFSEGAGGVSGAVLLGGAPLGLNADPNIWTSFSFMVTTGPDVTNGVTVQLAAITGADPGSTMFLCVDNLSVLVDGPVAGFRAFCNGDGGDQLGCTDCPCTNNAAPGTVGGCLNSAATSARLDASGDPSVTLPSGDTTDLRFGISGAPANAFCILNSGDALAPGNMANPCFGLGSGSQAAAFDGLRCAITNTRRHGGRSADVNGDVGVTNSPWGGEGAPPVGLAVAGGGFTSGQTRYFQVINRDDPLAGCGRGLNTSQAVEVTFTP